MIALTLAAALPALAESSYWTTRYAPPGHKETWTAELAASDLSRAVPAVLKAVEAEKGALSGPLGNFAASTDSQQLSFSLPAANGRSLLKRLRRVGAIADPLARPAWPPFPREEVRSKIRQLESELKGAPLDALAALPVTRQVVAELLRELKAADEAAARAETRLLVNLTVKKR